MVDTPARTFTIHPTSNKHLLKTGENIKCDLRKKVYG